MANASIAIDCLETLQIACDFPSEVALEHPFVLGDDVKNLVELLFREVLRPHIRVKASFLDEQIGPSGTDAVDVTEGKRDFLLSRNIDAEETRHGV